MTEFSDNTCLAHDCNRKGKVWGVIDKGTPYEFKLRYCVNHLTPLRSLLKSMLSMNLNDKKKVKIAERILKSTTKDYKKYLNKIIVECSQKRKSNKDEKLSRYKRMLKSIEMRGNKK